MTQTTAKRLTIVEWVTGSTVVLVVLVAWMQEREVFTGSLTLYDVFPLFGLLAFVLMWTHFILGSVRRLLGIKHKVHSVYWKLSSGLVLFSLIAHPLLLNTLLVQDGLGLPPASYQTAYGWKWVFLVLGSTALVVFLTFELHRWFSQKRWWKYIEAAQVFAMAAIFVHALMLGRELTIEWFAALWGILGISLVVSVVYNTVFDSRKRGGVWNRNETK